MVNGKRFSLEKRKNEVNILSFGKVGVSSHDIYSGI
jgi:hypothetical protein